MNVDFKATVNKPVSEVYNAIVDRNHMANYFAVGDKDLKEGEEVQWSFGKDGEETIKVMRAELDKCIHFTWQPTGDTTTVEINLTAVDDNKTSVSITETGWELTEKGAKKAMGQMWGWTDFFCCLKAYLLFHVNLRAGQKLS